MRSLVIIRRIAGESMLPHLLPGQIVVGFRPRKLHVGDVIVLVHEGLEKIKRIGHIDGDWLYVFGDHAAASTDSRQFGPIHRRLVVARIVWPH